METAYRNILPEYRKAMSDKLVETLEDLERYGRRWDRQKELDSCYAPPPPAEKMRVSGAAFTGTSGRYNAVAAVEKGVESAGASPKPTKPKEKKAKKAAKGSRCTSSRSSGGESKVVTAKVVNRDPSGGTEEVKTYAAALQGRPRMPNGPGNLSGPYGPGHGYGNEAWQGAPAPHYGAYRLKSGQNQISRDLTNIDK